VKAKVSISVICDGCGKRSLIESDATITGKGGIQAMVPADPCECGVLSYLVAWVDMDDWRRTANGKRLIRD